VSGAYSPFFVTKLLFKIEVNTAAGLRLDGAEASRPKSRTRRNITCSLNLLFRHPSASQLLMFRKLVLSDWSLGGITIFNANALSKASCFSSKQPASTRFIPLFSISFRNVIEFITENSSYTCTNNPSRITYYLRIRSRKSYAVFLLLDELARLCRKKGILPVALFQISYYNKRTKDFLKNLDFAF